MSQYVWQHDLTGEAQRLQLMSDLLDPSSRFHLLRTGVTTGWRCLEIGAGNGSLSQWLAHHVKRANIEIASGDSCHQVSADVGCDNLSGRTDLLREPL